MPLFPLRPTPDRLDARSALLAWLTYAALILSPAPLLLAAANATENKPLACLLISAATLLLSILLQALSDLASIRAATLRADQAARARKAKG